MKETPHPFLLERKKCYLITSHVGDHVVYVSEDSRKLTPKNMSDLVTTSKRSHIDAEPGHSDGRGVCNKYTNQTAKNTKHGGQCVSFLVRC